MCVPREIEFAPAKPPEQQQEGGSENYRQRNQLLPAHDANILGKQGLATVFVSVPKGMAEFLQIFRV
jgi:hypothetical protein